MFETTNQQWIVITFPMKWPTQVGWFSAEHNSRKSPHFAAITSQKIIYFAGHMAHFFGQKP
jgi:hypothetical protein